MDAESIQELATAFKRSRVLLSAVELGLFDALGNRGRPAAEVAAELGTDVRATDRMLRALCALELVELGAGDVFACTDAARRWLTSASPDCLTGLKHQAHLWDRWHTLTEAVRRGGRVSPVRPAGWTRDFIEAMHRRAREDAESFWAALDLEGVRDLLDLGGGSGVYSLAFVRGGAQRRATVLDLPEVTPLACEYAGRAGLSARVEFVSGDYHEVPLGEDRFDAVLASSILHIHSAGENRALLRRAALALRPRGRMIVREFLMEEDRTRPAFGTLFALNMLVATERGDTYTEGEIRDWLRAAGLADIERRDTGGRSACLVARRTHREPE